MQVKEFYKQRVLFSAGGPKKGGICSVFGYFVLWAVHGKSVSSGVQVLETKGGKIKEAKKKLRLFRPPK